MACSLYAVISAFRKGSKEIQPVNQQRGDGHLKLINAGGKWRLIHLIYSYRRATYNRHWEIKTGLWRNAVVPKCSVVSTPHPPQCLIK